MFMSPFGRVQYGDIQSVANWAKAHERAHITLGLAAMRAGNLLSQPILMGENISDDFFGRHGMAHLALSRYATPNSGVSSSLLVSSLNDWLSPEKFYAWHQMHDADHARLNAAYGVK